MRFIGGEVIQQNRKGYEFFVTILLQRDVRLGGAQKATCEFPRKLKSGSHTGAVGFFVKLGVQQKTKLPHS